ncbi:uncharacterized protein LOC135093600 [Scylla paramamosain]|uniref:uncharacterized protein LOC135093600 n=1 Tax=Scylla paramamosain TaxID=85552 RepID=UPI0030836611
MVDATTQRAGDPSGVSYVLETIYKQQQKTEAENWVATEMIELLKKKLNIASAPFLSSAEYKLVGSAAEKLAMSSKDDKDLLLVLGPPYTPEYFTSVYESHGRHYLVWNKRMFNGKRPQYVGNTKHLKALALRTFINGCLQSALKGERVGSSLHVSKLEVWKQAVRAHLRQDGGKENFIVDIIPQIRGDKWTKVKGVKPQKELGLDLQKTISALEASGESSIMFSLFGPAGTTPYTVTTCYALLEREFFLKNKALRDIAVLAKIILTGHNWKKRFGFKVAHLKRLLMARSEHFSALKPWQGITQLLSLAESQLRDGSLEGFPDLNSDLMWHKTDEDCHGIARAIADVMMTLDPQYLAMYLC